MHRASPNVRPGSHILRSTAPLPALAAVAVVAIVLVVTGGFVVTALGGAELPLAQALNSLHHGVIGALGDALYRGVGPVPALAGTIVLTAILLAVSRDLRVAATFAVTIAVTWLPVAAVKLLVDRPRPDVAALPYPYHPVQTDGSFPSGHATYLTVLVLTAVLLIRSRPVRIAAGVIGAVLVAGCGLLLAIDAVHYVSDVVGSIVWVLGVAPLVRALWVRIALPRLAFLTPRAVRAAGSPE